MSARSRNGPRGVTTTKGTPTPAASEAATVANRPPPEAPIDPRAVRVTVAPTSRMEADPTVTVGPAPIPVAALGATQGERASLALVDGLPFAARLEWVDDQRAVLVRGAGRTAERTRILLGPLRTRTADGIAVREIVVDGWRIDIELESERRAALRERARRGKEAAGRSGPLEVRAIIPGRIVAVSVAPSDAITAGQQLLVVEAMKMQNELRAPREGTIDRVAVAVGENVEVGDLLLVIS